MSTYYSTSDRTAISVTPDDFPGTSWRGHWIWVEPPTPGDPFGGDSDLDGDGVNNRDELNNVLALLGNCEAGRLFYATCAFDPGLDGTVLPPADMDVSGPAPMTACPLDLDSSAVTLQNVGSSLLVITDVDLLYLAGDTFSCEVPESVPVALSPGGGQGRRGRHLETSGNGGKGTSFGSGRHDYGLR